MFKEMGAELPLPTRIVIGLSDFVRGYILLIIAAIVGGMFALRCYYRTENGKSTIDALMLRVPMFGTIFRKVAVARFTRTLGTLSSRASRSSRRCASRRAPPATRSSRRRCSSAAPRSPRARRWPSR